jgi:hemerythrin-like domain-containing protein
MGEGICACGHNPKIEPEEGLAAWFTECHRTCDALWAKVEEAAELDDALELKVSTNSFVSNTRRHLEAEEKVLFPMLGEATGMGQGGPIGVMLHEHRQMFQFLDLMEAAAKNSDIDTLLSCGDTLLMLTQQHNVKEEQILYPMCEQVLQSQWEEIFAKLTGAA